MNRAIIALATVALVAVASMPIAEAQCPTGPRFFASIGGGMAAAKARVDASGPGAENAGNEVARFWETANSDNGNNWGVGGGGTLDPNRLPLNCQSQTNGWWATTQTTLRAWDGAVSVAGCEANTCPAADMTFLVEDWDSNGPPGVGGTAYWISDTTNFDAAGTVGNRQWNLQQPLGPNNAVVPMAEHPRVIVTNSGKVGNDIQITFDYPDAGDGAFVDNGSTTADSYAVAAVDLLVHYGPTDPGRARYATCGGAACTNQGAGGDCCWNATGDVAGYADGPINGRVFTIDCGDRSTNAWVSAGIIFNGGGGAKDVQSALVGEAVQLQCDPTLAEPEPDIRPGYKQRRNPGRQPSRSGR